MSQEETNMKISMIGCGKLGGPCAEVMSEHYDVIGYDINNVVTSLKMADSIKDAVYDRDIIFVAVPTPHDPEYDGSKPIGNLPPKNFDYSIVENVLKEINLHVNSNQLVVLISTVLPGTVRRYLRRHITNCKFIYNPYLIAMGTVKYDMVNPECLIIGTENGSETGDAKVLVDFYKPIMKNNPRVNIGTWDEAESIKIFYNTFISVKIGLVNMIQDVAERLGNINVDVVTDALKHATHRITGPKYLTAGMGDSGACHPRDNIALRWLSKDLNLGYDMFHTIMETRDKQAEHIANKLIELSIQHNLPIVIHGKTYKPYVPYIDGSYSLLVGHHIENKGHEVNYADPLTGDFWGGKAVILMAHCPEVTYVESNVSNNITHYFNIESGSVILDPWRKTRSIKDVLIIQYGNSRIS